MSERGSCYRGGHCGTPEHWIDVAIPEPAPESADQARADVVLSKAIHLAISDPGASTPRLLNENVSAWSTRAVERIVADRLAARDAEHAAEVETRLDSMHDLARTYRHAGDEYLRRAEAAEATVARVRKYLAAMGDPADPKHLHPQAAGVLLAVQAALDDDPALRAALDGER